MHSRRRAYLAIAKAHHGNGRGQRADIGPGQLPLEFAEALVTQRGLLGAAPSGIHAFERCSVHPRKSEGAEPAYVPLTGSAGSFGRSSSRAISPVSDKPGEVSSLAIACWV